MNGIVVTTALRKEVCTKAVELLMEFTPEPYRIVISHCPATQEIDDDWPKKLADKHGLDYLKAEVASPGGCTEGWNMGFQHLLDKGCDIIVQVSDDVFVNKTWPEFFKTIEEHKSLAIFGPVSSKPGVDYTGKQLQPWAVNKKWVFNKSQKAGSRAAHYYCVNGFCWALKAPVVDELIKTYGAVLDQENWPWGGQDEDLGRRIEKMGGELVVDGRTWVQHIKHGDWRTLKLYLRQKNKDSY